MDGSDSLQVSLSLVHELLFVRIEKEARSCLLLEITLFH